MKKLILIVLASALLFGCASTSSTDTQKCIQESSIPQTNKPKSGDQVFRECLDRQYQTNEREKSFLEEVAEGIVIFILDIATS
jgi:uncharacterized protein YcfL